MRDYNIWLIIAILLSSIILKAQNEDSKLTNQQLYELRKTLDRSENLHGRSQDSISILIATITFLVGFGAFFGYANVKSLQQDIVSAQKEVVATFDDLDKIRIELSYFQKEKKLIQQSFEEYMTLYSRSIADVVAMTTYPIEASSNLSKEAKAELRLQAYEIIECQELLQKDIDVLLTALQQIGQIGTVAVSLPYVRWFYKTRLQLFQTHERYDELEGFVINTIGLIQNRF